MQKILYLFNKMVFLYLEFVQLNMPRKKFFLKYFMEVSWLSSFFSNIMVIHQNNFFLSNESGSKHRSLSGQKNLTDYSHDDTDSVSSVIYLIFKSFSICTIIYPIFENIFGFRKKMNHKLSKIKYKKLCNLCSWT